MPSLSGPHVVEPEWQSQSHLNAFTRTIVRQPSRTSQNSETESPTSSKRNSMLGSLKSSFRRKGSNASRESTETSRSVSPQPASFRGPTELNAGMANLSVSPVPQQQHSNPLTNPSPATRRPGRPLHFSHPQSTRLIQSPDRPGMNAFTVPSNEPPPAYTASPTATSGPTLGPSPAYTPPRAASPAPSNASSARQEEDPYTFLTQFDTLLLIDDSGSMAGRSWRETSFALSQLLPIIVARDADGIDIFFLNHISSDPGSAKDGVAAGGYRNVKDAAEVERIFKTVKPGGGTPTGTRCRAILKPYISKLEVESKKGKIDEVKPLNILAITDGVPSDDVESVIIAAAKKLDVLEAAPHQVGLQFFQVGNEEGAADALRELDDGLADMVHGGVRDMVDTCTWMGGESTDGELKLSAQGMLKVVLGAVVKRLDRRRLSGEMVRPAASS